MHRGRGPAKQIVAVGRVRTGSSGDPKPQKIHQSRWECSGGLSYDPRDSEARPQVRLDCGPHVASSSISGAPAALDWHHVTLIHHVVRFDRRSAHDLLFEPNYPPGVHESSQKHAIKPSRKSRKQEAASKLKSIRPSITVQLPLPLNLPRPWTSSPIGFAVADQEQGRYHKATTR